jgi:hypothetical protein
MSYGGSTVIWLRGGTSPEVSRTAFDYTTNGVNWNALDTGVRIAGGWQLTNVLLSAGSTIRARGWVTGGYQNGSSWFVEARLPLSPRLLVSDSHFGFTAGRFGFTLQALPGDVVVVEGSTNLLDWFPLQTNVYSNAPIFLRDPVSTNGPQQFYRATLLP